MGKRAARRAPLSLLLNSRWCRSPTQPRPGTRKTYHCKAAGTRAERARLVGYQELGLALSRQSGAGGHDSVAQLYGLGGRLGATSLDGERLDTDAVIG